MKRGLGVAFVISMALIAGCTTATKDIGATKEAGHNNLNSTLWMQTAAEYRANSIQTYRAAHTVIDAAVKDVSWTGMLEQGKDFSALPPAIVLDIDETVLDNSPYQAQLIIDHAEWALPTWDKWIELRAATAVPGAVDFINAVSGKVRVVFITNRECKVREGSSDLCPQKADTIANLEKAGIKVVRPEDVLLKAEKPEWTSEKQSRRECIASKYRVVMLFGDDLGDFLPNVKKKGTPPVERKNLVDKYKENWGSKWFFLSNPSYGSWLDILNEPTSQYLKGL